MVKPYWKYLPAFHVPNSYDEMVPLRHPMVKAYPPRAAPPYLGPLAYLATVATVLASLVEGRDPEL